MEVQAVETRAGSDQPPGERQCFFRPHSFPDPMAQESEEESGGNDVESEAEHLEGDAASVSRGTLFHEPSNPIETTPPG